MPFKSNSTFDDQLPACAKHSVNDNVKKRLTDLELLTKLKIIKTLHKVIGKASTNRISVIYLK